jgi:CheY-like chemotaxis protein
MGWGKILVVEDEWLIAAALADTLSDMGFSVVGPASTAAEALDLVGQECPDCALLDVSLGTGKSFAVAESLRARGIPFVFLTGYLTTDLPAVCRDAPILAKPVRDADLKRLLPSLLAARGAAGTKL